MCEGLKINAKPSKGGKILKCCSIEIVCSHRASQLVRQVVLSQVSGKLCSLTLSYSRTSGCARFVGSFVFNRKRNVVELDLKQDTAAKGTMRYVVSVLLSEMNSASYSSDTGF